LGIFTKEERMNKETGKFETTKKGLVDRVRGVRGETPVSDKLLAQERAKNKYEKKMARMELKKQYREEFNKAKKEATLARAKREGKRVGSMSAMDRLDNFSKGFASPPNYSTRNNYNPFGSMFDTGLTKPKTKSNSKTKYKVIGGKAYPIAGTGKKKTKKKQSSGFGGWDMMDNYGFFK